MLGNHIEVTRGGVVVVIVQAVRVGKMRAGTAQDSGLFIHHPDKVFDRAADVARQHIRRLVARGQQQAV